MLNEKWYLARVDMRDSIKDEYYEKLVEKEEDPRVIAFEDMYIFVNSENKEAIESEYLIKLKPLKYKIVENIMQRGDIEESLHEISNKDENIGKFVWDNIISDKQLIKKLGKEILDVIIDKLYQHSDEQILDLYFEGYVDDYISKYLKKECYKLYIKHLQEIYKEEFSE